jgi:tRNA (guanine-N7-)-methyltransferase
MSILLRASELATPMAPSALFSRPGPVVFEVGFGDGRYLEHLASAHPDWNLIGAEVSLGSVWRAYRRMQRAGIEDVRLFKGNARFLVRDVFEQGSLDRVFVNFPDPWPRKKHHKNRLLQVPFFRILSSRLKPGGSLFLTTDHPEYFEFSLGQGRESGCFDVIEGPPPPATLETKYARKWRDQQKPIYHVEFRCHTVIESAPRIITAIDMQHATLKGSLENVGAFSKQVRRFQGGHAFVMEAYRELGSQGLLFKAISEEQDFRQELLIQAWPKEGGVYVSLQPFGDPMTTKGVREAVLAVTDWLVSQGLELDQTWV